MINKTITSIFRIALSNIIKLFSGVLVGFILPKLIGIEDYAYYKTFTLYATYVGIFQIGIADGIYLKFGGIDYDNLNKKEMRFYSTLLLGLETIFSIVCCVVSVLFLRSEYRFIFICIAIYLFSYNITCYYQFVSQLTRRFNELFKRNIIQSLLTIISVVILWVCNYYLHLQISYKYYLFLYLIIQIMLSIWYVWTYKEITFGPRETLNDHQDHLKDIIKNGIPLMLANLCLLFILNMDRQFVNVLFDVKTYAIYAFAYNMLSLITTATTAISTVLYPSLKRSDKNNLSVNYEILIIIVLVLMFGMISIYFPLDVFIRMFLPKYSDSLIIFRIILPGLALSSVISIVIHNYYKVVGKNFLFLKIGIIIFVMAIIFNLIAYLLFRTTSAISIASIVVFFIWYIITQKYFIRTYKVNWKKSFIYILIMMLCFYLTTSNIINVPVGFSVYILSHILITIIFFKDKKKLILNVFKKK